MKIEQGLKTELNVEIKLTINESEARALDALVGYGFEPFIKVFYANLGQTYMRPHHEGCKSLFETVNKELSGKLYQVDLLKKHINNFKES